MDRSIGKKVFHGTLIIVLVGILAKLTSFISEAILAAYLGTTYRSDAFYMVSSVQQVFYPMLSVGIWKVFLPEYKQKITQNAQSQAESLTNKVITFFTLLSLAVVTLVVIFAAPVVSLVAPGFEGETRDLCIKLVRISAPMYIFIIAAAVYASVLQCHNKFLGSQIREVASHLPVIFAAILLYKTFGIEVLAIALVAGGAFRLLVELPFVDWGYRFKPDFKFKTKEFILMIKRLPSALISEGVTQLNTLVDKAMASTLPEGTISGLNYGNKLMNVFSGLLSTAIATALYPQMIELIALKKTDELSKLVEKIINIFCLLMVPVTMACVFFRKELVSAVFERGSFDANSVSLTSGVFALYCIGILFVACNTVITNVFYGFGNTQTPMYISIANLAINVALNLVFIHFWGVNGLAFATSLSAIISLIIRLIASKKYLNLRYNKLLVMACKTLFISVIACGVPRTLFNVIDLNKFLVLIVSAVIGFALYIIGAKLLKIDELNDMLFIVRKKVLKSR